MAAEVWGRPCPYPEKARSMAARTSSRNGTALVATGWRVTLKGIGVPNFNTHRGRVRLIRTRVRVQIRLGLRRIGGREAVVAART